MNPTEQRKKEHIDVCVKKDVAFKEKTTLLENIELNYKTLPEISFDEVDLRTTFLNKNFDFPFLVSAITGGAQIAKKINKDIATACSQNEIGMGLGSMRAMLENKELASTYYVRDVAPDIFVSANLGVAQLKEYSTNEVNEALNSIEVDALAIHLNAAQEAMQPEGDLDFRGVIEQINIYSKEINVPVYVKEVGHGISFEVASVLKNTNIKAIDVQGAGGTSWTRVDSLRHKKSFGIIFRDFGIPTAVSIIETRNALENQMPIIATGGIRDGLEGVKAIVLGANMVGNAMPILKAQQKSVNTLNNYLENFKKEMQITSFLLGCKNIGELQEQDYVVLGKLREWLNQ